MRTTFITLALAAAPLPNHIDAPRMLDAIRQVEGHKWTNAGGAYAIQPSTWKQHTKLPYRYASSPAHAEFVGEKHLAWLARGLRDDGYPVTPYTLAACWRFGLEGYKRRQDVIDYACRVRNIYDSKR